MSKSGRASLALQLQNNSLLEDILSKKEQTAFNTFLNAKTDIERLEAQEMGKAVRSLRQAIRREIDAGVSADKSDG